MMRRWHWWFALIVAALTILAAPVILAGAYGWHLLPADKSPGLLPAYQRRVLQIAWRAEGDSDVPLQDLDRPPSISTAIGFPSRPPMLPSVVNYTVRIWLRTNGVHLSQGDRHLAALVMGIYVANRWTMRECLSYLLHNANFGHGATGLDEAARSHFGLSIEELTDFELAQIIGMLQSPSMYDPRLHPARNKTRANSILGQFACFPSRIRHASEYNACPI